MGEQVSDEKVYSRGILALEDKLGPVETLRFLAIVSRQNFDYQQWRIQHFSEKSLDEIFNEAEATQR
jgi:hypothetical protein